MCVGGLAAGVVGAASVASGDEGVGEAADALTAPAIRSTFGSSPGVAGTINKKRSPQLGHVG